MRQRLVIALLTLCGFVAGFGARILTESKCKVPPPPTAGSEFMRKSQVQPANDTERRAPTYTEAEREKLLGDIEKLRPQIELYQKRLDEIADEYERDVMPILTSEQRAKYEVDKKRNAEQLAKGEREVAATTTLSDEQIFKMQQLPIWNALWNVAINARLEWWVRDYHLSPDQQKQLRAILVKRREKFLALVDAVPPPSIVLSQLAPQAEKLKTKKE